MTSTATAAISGRFRDLADTLTRNATILATAGLPETVMSVRAEVYRDVAAQLHLLAEAEATEGNPLVVVLAETDAAIAVARRLEQLAGQLTRNARLLTTRTTDPVMHCRATVYRDVAAQARLWAEDEAAHAAARPRYTSRPPLSTVLAGPNPLVEQAAIRAPRVRPAFLDALVDSIAARRRQGWSVARLTLWLRTTLRDPQTDAIHPCAQRSFVSYVTELLTPTPAGRDLRAA
ncbi:hypothetical protein AB0K15_18925 [Amycolatopsis sp. NPDC049253]|uniref:hypothetical protein n=1 Tax=Amycolatopsis sp. NPDC049253 TaxID=3155274 RepID=UPI00342CA79C